MPTEALAGAHFLEERNHPTERAAAATVLLGHDERVEPMLGRALHDVGRIAVITVDLGCDRLDVRSGKFPERMDG